jgi:AcrR family transcriptional regulator
MPRDASRPAPSQQPARDAQRTKAAILAAATDEFAAHGLSGARVDRIAQRAGTNKRMLYYYFGDKEALYLAVLEAAYEQIRSDEQRLRLLELAPREGVRQLCVFTWGYLYAHPEFISLLNTENLHRARNLKRSDKVRALHSPLVKTLSELLRRGRRDGVFRDGIDAVQLYVSIASLCYFYLSNAHTLSTIFGRDLMSAPARSRRLKHVVDLVLHSLAPAAPPLARGRPANYAD